MNKNSSLESITLGHDHTNLLAIDATALARVCGGMGLDFSPDFGTGGGTAGTQFSTGSPWTFSEEAKAISAQNAIADKQNPLVKIGGDFLAGFGQGMATGFGNPLKAIGNGLANVLMPMQPAY